jgi:hypothetical protein
MRRGRVSAGARVMCARAARGGGAQGAGSGGARAVRERTWQVDAERAERGGAVQTGRGSQRRVAGGSEARRGGQRRRGSDRAARGAAWRSCGGGVAARPKNEASVRRMAAGRRWCAAREQTRREHELGGSGGVVVESYCARGRNAMAVSRTQLRCSTKCRYAWC